MPSVWEVEDMTLFVSGRGRGWGRGGNYMLVGTRGCEFVCV